MKISGRLAYSTVFVGLAVLFALIAYAGFAALFVYRELGGPVGSIRYWVFQLMMFIGFLGVAANISLAIRAVLGKGAD